MSGPLVDLLLAKSYDPDVRVRRTVTALAGAGFQVRVLAWDRTGRHVTMEDDHGVLIQRVKVRSRPSRGWTQVFFLARVALRMLPLLRERRPAVLHAVNLPMLAVAVALAPLLGRPRPVIVYDAFEIHALMGVDRYPTWLITLIGLIERLLPRFADLVITPGDDRRGYFQRLGIESVSVPNWIDPPADAPDRATARAALGIAPEQFCLAYVGGIIGSRDLLPMIEHARRYPSDLVLVAGSGDAVDDLARLADGVPNVRLLGWQPDPGGILSAADALYYALKPDHAYARHAAPNNLYQAVARTLPLVYRNQGELAAVAARHRIGIPFRDQDSLDSAIHMLRDPAVNQAIRAELASLQRGFSEGAAASRLVGAYRGVLARRAPVRGRRRRRPILLVTRIWPTAERPSVGSFVRARARGVPGLIVVKPRWDRLPRLLLYGVLLIDAMRVGPTIRGVEAHMLVPTGFVGLLVARLRRVPLVVYAHGRDVRDWKRRSLPMRWLARHVAVRADRIVTNSADTARYVQQMGVVATVIPPGVDLHRFRPSPRPAQRRVLYLGGRNRRKGYAIAADLADTLVGPWLRDVEPDEIPALIAEHDVVLVPSVAEPFGLVAVEAIASGRWVVASDVGGLRDIVIDGVNGTIVADGDFAAALAAVPDYDPFVIAATVQRFSLERWQRGMADIWDQLAPAAEPTG